MTNIEIVTKMVENGYHMMGESIEHMTNTFTNAELMRMLNGFLKWKGIE